MSNEIILAEKLFFESLDCQLNGDFYQAKEKLELAFNYCPSRPSIINNLMLIYVTLKDKRGLEQLFLEVSDENNKYKKFINIYIELLNKDYSQCINSSIGLLKDLDENEIDKIYDVLIKCYFQIKDLNKLFYYLRISLRSKNFYDQKLYNIGTILLYLSKPLSAIQYLNKAIEIKKDSSYLSSIAQCHLKLKNFDDGFKLWENRWGVVDRGLILFQNIPSLDKLSEIVDKDVVVWHELGLGDTLNFARYVKLLKRYTNKITFVVQNSLVELMNDFDEIIKISSYEKASDKSYDYQIPLVSLLTKLNIQYNHIPFYQLNLSQSNDDYKLSSKLNVGFANKGNPDFVCDAYRSISSKVFAELFHNEKITFYQLSQNHSDPIKKYSSNIVDLSDLEIAEISKILSKFDYIITTDTFFVHLCGILNINCICLLSKNPEWRWFDDKKTTIWYPSVRILKQKKINDWSYPFSVIKRFLKQKLLKR